MRAWPRVLSFSLGMVPVAMFGAIVVVMLLRSVPAIQAAGLGELFGTTFSSQYGTGENIFGLVPAIWGTLTITVVAIAIALPVSVAMALIASEFQLGYLSSAMRLVLGVLSGIPSIVYALAAVVFVSPFMIPKFAADSSSVNDFTPAKIGFDGAWPPSDVPFDAGAFPWSSGVDPNSTILGGALIALLVIPFMTPMVEDAIRGVPTAVKEASMALGTNRWHTLRRVVLPYAAPGLVSATALASLKAMGDVLIVAFVVGFEAPGVPNPLFDVFQRNPSLTAIGSNLLGGFRGQGLCSVQTKTAVSTVVDPTLRCDTAYFSAFLLVIVALAVVTLSSVLQARLRRRLAP